MGLPSVTTSAATSFASLASGEFSTIRLRLLKIAVRIKETESRGRLAFASSCPDAALFRGLVGTLILRPT